MLITFTEAQSKGPVAINPNQIVSVFTVEKSESEAMKPFVGKTAIVFSGGNVIVEDSYLEVVGKINGELR
jgi:hypothetical protein